MSSARILEYITESNRRTGATYDRNYWTERHLGAAGFDRKVEEVSALPYQVRDEETGEVSRFGGHQGYFTPEANRAHDAQF